MKRFIFVCGCARSGTSVVTYLLNAHPEVAIGMERYISRFLSGAPFTPELFDKRRFFAIEKGDTFYDSLDFQQALYESMRSRWDDCLVVGDKIPKLYTRYDRVLEDFPDSKVIFVARNLIDIANSYKRRAENPDDKEWSRERGAEVAVADWNKGNRLTLEAIARHPDRIHVLSYEALYLERRGLEALFDFVGLRPGRAVRAHFHKQLHRSMVISSKRSDRLTAAEKLDICRRADTESFRKLLDHSAAHLALQMPAADAKELTRQDSRELPHRIATGMKSRDSTTVVDPRSGKYQDTDQAIVDYRYSFLPGTDGSPRSLVRGPIPADLSGGFVAFLGGAHTFGRFVQRPYPILLQDSLGVPTLNLGHGGGKPEFYVHSRGFIDVINRARCAVIQVMSARGSPNRFLKPTTHTENIMEVADGIVTAKNPLFVDAAYRVLLRQLDRGQVQQAIRETRDHWVAGMQAMLEKIHVPKVLFWFSVRQAGYSEGFQTVDALLGEYPQLVTEEMMDRLRPLASLYVECVSKAGLPSTLRDATTGKPVPVFRWQEDPSINYYYPSQEMHDTAALALSPALRKLI